MKQVLITGLNSYIGNSFESWVLEHSGEKATARLREELVCSKISLRGDDWKQKSFAGYNTILHVAGKAHADVGKASGEEQQEYYRVNCDLAVECARKAKADGVKQFLYLSSIIVYGDSAPLHETEREHRRAQKAGKNRTTVEALDADAADKTNAAGKAHAAGLITPDTPAAPANFYGDSKLRAEEALTALSDDSFRVCIVRPPMIYGPGSKGNYALLEKMAGILPIFPDIRNQRSVLSIENLCRALYVLITQQCGGTYYPQDAAYGVTAQMVQALSAAKGRKIHLTKVFNPMLRLLSHGGGRLGGYVNKAFGSLYYDMEMSNLPAAYRTVRRSDPTTRSGQTGQNEPTTQSGQADPIARSEESKTKQFRDKNGTAGSVKKAEDIRVSVVTVCYHAAEELPRTMESVLNQTMPPYEYLVIDGGSEDGTVQIAEQMRPRFEEKGIRLVVLSEADKGTYDAMNKGARLAAGDIVGFLNAGDTYEPDCIRLTTGTFARTGCDCSFGDLKIRRQDGSTLLKRARLRRFFQTSRNWNHPTMFVRRALMVRRPFPCKGIHDDYGFYLWLVKQGYRIQVIPHPLATFAMGGISNHKSLKEAKRRILDRYRYCYRRNGYSRLYMIECIFIEGVKALL